MKTPANVSLFDHLHLEISTVLSRDKGDIAIRVRIAPVTRVAAPAGAQHLSSRVYHTHGTLPKFNSSTLKNGGWKNYAFLLGFGNFSGATV